MDLLNFVSCILFSHNKEYKFLYIQYIFLYSNYNVYIDSILKLHYLFVVLIVIFISYLLNFCQFSSVNS